MDLDIDADALSEAIGEILGDKDDDGKDIGERLEEAAEKLTDMVEVDEYVEGLPDKTKELAQHLRTTQKENEDRVEKLLGEKPDISYDDYVKEMDKAGEGHVSRESWEAIAARLREEAEEQRDEKKDKAKFDKADETDKGDDKAETIPKGEPKEDGS